MTLTAKDYEKQFCLIIKYDVLNNHTLSEAFKININTRKLICFTDAAHGNYIQK